MLRDFHATGKGVTPYAKLWEETVTLAGTHWDMGEIWETTGESGMDRGYDLLPRVSGR